MSTSQKDVQLEDLLAFYPPVAIPRFQEIISAKKEFKELESGSSERLRKARGSFFKHQKFVQRFMQHYDQLLLFHETGTGKSCAMTAIAEMSKNLYLRDKTNINHAYIIVSNSTLIDRIQREIVCKCTDGVYDVTRFSRNPSREARKNLSKWYTIVTRQTFAKKLKNLTNEEIVQKYSNKIFFIDEAHNLNFEPFKGELMQEEDFSIRRERLKKFQVSSLKKLANQAGIGITIPAAKKEDIITLLFSDDKLSNELIDSALEDDTYKKVKTKKKIITEEMNKEEIYIQYWRLFHLIQNSKTVLATATPMLNESAEIRDLMNLLLPSKIPLTTFPFPDKDDFKTRKINIESLEGLLYISPNDNMGEWNDNDLEKVFRGRVSYVRRLDTGVNVEYVGIPISEILRYPHQTDYDAESKVYAEEMGEFQSKAYIEASKFGGGLRPKEHWASNFVYPDGSYGIEGTDKYFRRISEGVYTVKKEKKRGMRFQEGIDFEKDLEKPIGDPSGIYKYSVKFANIISLINSVKGNVFVYSNLTKAGGTIPFSVCLENQGFERFYELKSVFQTTQTTLPEYCRSGQSSKRIKKDFKKKLRYFNLHTGITAPKLEIALELMNSPENVHGEYIKVFMTSGVGGEGISLSNVIQIHIIDGDWKHSTNYQAESRAIRATSHNDLLAISPGEINVEIYNHASYTCIPGSPLPEERPSKGKEKSTPTYTGINAPGDLCMEVGELLSVDVRMYELSEQKDREIKRMERIIKRTSVDCQTHFRRNTRIDSSKIKGKDGTAECDYRACVYECWDPTPKYTDYSTYDVYYIDEPVEAIISILKEYFKIHFSITMEEVLRLIREDVYSNLFIDIPAEMKYVQYASEEILNNHIPFLNRYGQVSYLQKDGYVLFLTLDYPVEDIEDNQKIDSDVVNYTADLVGTAYNTLESIVNTQLEEEAGYNEEELEGYSIDSAKFQKLYYSLNIHSLSELLENAIIRRLEGNEDFLATNILNKTSPNKEIIDIPGYGRIYPYVGSWHKIPEPLWFLKRVQMRLDRLTGKEGNTSGRRPKKGRTPDPIKYNPEEIHDFKIDLGPEEYKWGSGGLLPEDEQPEEVYFHTLYSLEPGNSSYDYVPKFNNVSGTIRLYKPSEKKWRDTTSVEQVVYSLWAQKVLHGFKGPFETKDVYGFFVSGPKPDFRLVPKYEEREMQILRDLGVTKAGGGRIPKNKGLSKGRRCNDYSVSDLLRIVSVMGLNPPKDIPGDFSREDAITEIRENKKGKAIRENDGDIFLENVWRWVVYLRGVSKEKKELCAVIQEYLGKEELIYQTY